MMIKSTIIFCVLFLIQTIAANSQDSFLVDSLLHIVDQTNSPDQQLKAYNELSYQFHTSDTVLTKEYAVKAIELSKMTNNIKEKGEAYKCIGMTYGYFGQNRKAVQHYEEAYKCFQSIQDTIAMVKVLNNMGRQLSSLGQHEKAIQGYLEATSWLPIGKDSLLYLILKFNHAACLSASLQHRAAIDLCEEVLPVAIALDYWYIQAELYSLQGVNYTELRDFPMAEACYSKAFNSVPRASVPTIGSNYISNNSDLEANILNNRALLYIEQTDYVRAYQDLKLAVEILENIDDQQLNGEIYVNLAIVSQNMNRWQESEDYFQEGLKRLEKVQEQQSIGEIHGHLADLYSAMGNGMLAYQHLKLSHQIQDSLLSERTQKNLQELNVKYETEKFKHELALTQLQIQTQHNQIYLILASFIILFLLGGLSYYFFYTKQQRRLMALEKKQTELKYGLLRAQMNPHFIFNAMHAIHGFFASNQLIKGSEFIAKFSQLMRKILDQSALSTHSLSDEVETLRLYLDIEKERLGGDLDYSICIDVDLEADCIELPPLILQPFVENAVWHGIAPKNDKGHIWIDIQMRDDHELLCKIQDNGVGISEHLISKKTSHESKGIQISKERLGNRGRVHIANNPGKEGVIVQVNILID